MTETTKDAIEALARLGFRGHDVYLAELIPAVEMAWADGVIQPNERAMLESYCIDLVDRLNRAAGAQFFSLARAIELLDRLTARRLGPSDRQAALLALKAWTGTGLTAHERRKRMLQWAEAVAAVDGKPVWDTRELFWLQALKRNLEQPV